MSIRKIAQKLMVENDLIRFVVEKLNKERETMSDYLMEYTTALLLNILLSKEGLSKS